MFVRKTLFLYYFQLRECCYFYVDFGLYLFNSCVCLFVRIYLYFIFKSAKHYFNVYNFFVFIIIGDTF